MGRKNISKYISLILRHRPEVIGITLDEHGWAEVDELIEGIRRTKQPSFNRRELEKIVAEDEKQRYSFSDDRTRIRANQGHSIPVDVELEKKTPPPTLWHGTAEKSVESILRSGLLPQGRLYVHLSGDCETAVKVGSRHGRPVVFEVDTGKMSADGFEFFLSVNGVWLTKEVPPRYLRKLSSSK